MFIWQSSVCTYICYLYKYSDSLFNTRFMESDRGTMRKTALGWRLLYWAIAVGNIFKWKSRTQVVWEMLFCFMFPIISFICSEIILGNMPYEWWIYVSISETVYLYIIRG